MVARQWYLTLIPLNTEVSEDLPLLEHIFIPIRLDEEVSQEYNDVD